MTGPGLRLGPSLAGALVAAGVGLLAFGYCAASAPHNAALEYWSILLGWWVPTSRFRHSSLSWGPEAVECGSYVGEHSNADIGGACHPEEPVDCAVVVEPNG